MYPTFTEGLTKLCRDSIMRSSRLNFLFFIIMNKGIRNVTVLVTFLLVGLLLFNPFFLMKSQANTLGEGYLFLSRMQTDTATDLTGMFTPATAFDSGTRELRILFPESEGAWCKDATNTVGNLTVTAATTSAIDQGDWTIDAGLPAEDPGVVDLEATCYQGGVGENDYIEITGVGALTAGTSYGFEIDADTGVFRTGSNIGSNFVSYRLIQDTKIETITFSIALIDSDQVTVEALVSEVDTITCTVGSDVNLGALFLGGAYVTGDHGLTTEATAGLGFYWSVYGEGNGTNAGLYKSDATADLLPSTGTAGVVDLVGGDGFGLVLSAANLGTREDNYNPSVLGAGNFGAIQRTPILILQSSTGGSGAYTVTLGARAGVGRQAGNYTETLTYVCGGYVGTPTP
jgi:hypothetical protein